MAKGIVVQGLGAAALLTAAAAGAGPGDTDWLIENRGDDWHVVARGPAGQVQKSFTNQEVVRLQGSMVIVVSMPPIAGEEEVHCPARARQDANELCSSNFLSCRPDPGGFFATAFGLLKGRAAAAADQRNRYTCRIDEDAVLSAAKSAGVISRIQRKPAP